VHVCRDGNMATTLDFMTTEFSLLHFFCNAAAQISTE